MSNVSTKGVFLAKTPLMYQFSNLTLYLRAIVGVSLVVSGVGMQREKQKEKKTQNEKKEKQREEIENKKKNPKKISVLEGKLKRRKKKDRNPSCCPRTLKAHWSSNAWRILAFTFGERWPEFSF